MWSELCQAWVDLDPKLRAGLEGGILMAAFQALKWLGKKFPWFPQLQNAQPVVKFGLVALFSAMLAYGAVPTGPLKAIIVEFLQRFAAAVLGHNALRIALNGPAEHRRNIEAARGGSPDG